MVLLHPARDQIAQICTFFAREKVAKVVKVEKVESCPKVESRKSSNFLFCTKVAKVEKVDSRKVAEYKERAGIACSFIFQYPIKVVKSR